MSQVSDNATVRMLLADYAVVDAVGKVNVIGGGVAGIGQNPGTGLTLPFALFVSIAVPPSLYNEECSVEIALEDVAGDLVNLPAPAPGMEPQALRVGQAIRLDEPKFQTPVSYPARFLPARYLWVVNFSPGLPLVAGQGYTWRVRIDGETRDEWTERFAVAGPVAGPVIG